MNSIEQMQENLNHAYNVFIFQTWCVAIGFLVCAFFWYQTLWRCVHECPKDERVGWVLIIVFVPFGWLMYRFTSFHENGGTEVIEFGLPPRSSKDLDSMLRSGVNTPFAPKISDEEIIAKRQKDLAEKRRLQNLKAQIDGLGKPPR